MMLYPLQVDIRKDIVIENKKFSKRYRTAAKLNAGKCERRL